MGYGRPGLPCRSCPAATSGRPPIWGAVQPASARDARSMLFCAPAVGVRRVNTRLTHRRDGAPRLVERTVAVARLVRGRRAPCAPASSLAAAAAHSPPAADGWVTGGIWTFGTRRPKGGPPRGRLPRVAPPNRRRRRPSCRAGPAKPGPAKREMLRAALPFSVAGPLWQF